MGNNSKKIIMIIITIIVVISVIAAAAIIIVKNSEEEVVVQEDIYKLPDQALYYINDSIYKDGIDPSTINKNIKVDYTEFKVKQGNKKNLNIDIKNELTLLQKNKNVMYGLYEGAIVTINEVNKIRKITPEDEKVISFKVKGDNIVKYVERTRDKAKKKEYALEVFNLYNESVKGVAIEQIKTFDVDEDGIYFVYASGKLKDKIIRVLWNNYTNVIIGDDLTDQIVKVEDWIYYINKSKDNQLVRLYKDGTKKEIVSKSKLEVPKKQVGKYWADGYISGYLDTLYYINTEDNSKLYKVQISTGAQAPITNESVETFKLENGYIYYTLNTEEGLFVMHEDGTHVNKILKETPPDYIAL